MNEPPRGEEPEGQAERGDFKRREVAASATGARRVCRVNVTPLAGPKRGLGLRSREPLVQNVTRLARKAHLGLEPLVESRAHLATDTVTTNLAGPARTSAH